jgi:hypothetical protein
LPTNTKQAAASSATTALETVHFPLKNIVLRRPGRHARRKQRYAKSEFWSISTPGQTQQDGAECRIAAYGHYPYKELVVEHAHSATTTEDANQMVRDADAAYCLQAKGYTFQRTK